MLGALRVLQALGLAFHKGLPSVGTWLVEQRSCSSPQHGKELGGQAAAKVALEAMVGAASGASFMPCLGSG